MIVRKLLFILLLSIFACDQGEDILNETLDAYIVQSGLEVSTNLIACAASFPLAEVENDLSNSIFFLPLNGANNFRYFETKSIADDPDDFNNYLEVQLKHEPVFNFLKKFNREVMFTERWCKVTFELNDSLHICNAIRLKEPVKPSEINPDRITIENNQDESITFRWEDGVYPDNAIYFQVVSDSMGQLVTGTYTYDRFFTLFDYDNVVLNINSENQVHSLAPGNYQFTLMAVSIDNWVNLLGTKDFIIRN